MGNDLAHAELLISCESDFCFGIVEHSRREMYPEGDAALSWMNLVEKYEPKTKSNLIKLKKEFMECGLEDPTKEPEEWLMTLENLRQSEEDMMVHILHDLPSAYKNTIEIMENDLENGDYRESLRNKYSRIESNDKKMEN